MRNSQANLDAPPDLRQHADILTDVPTCQRTLALPHRVFLKIQTRAISTGDEEVDDPARDQKHRENDQEHDADHEDRVHFPNVIIPPENYDPVRRGIMKRSKSGRTVKVYGILPPFSGYRRIEHLQTAISDSFHHGLKRTTATFRISQAIELRVIQRPVL